MGKRRKVIDFPSVGGFLKGPYDIDGWRLATLDGGDQIIDLRLGNGFMIYALAARDSMKRSWTLILIDCAVAEVEVEVAAEELEWVCEPLQLPVPVAGPPLEILEGPHAGPKIITAAKVMASLDPFQFRLEVVIANDEGAAADDEGTAADDEGATCVLVAENSAPWCLVTEDGTVIVEDLRFKTGFNISCTGKEPTWCCNE